MKKVSEEGSDLTVTTPSGGFHSSLMDTHKLKHKLYNYIYIYNIYIYNIYIYIYIYIYRFAKLGVAGPDLKTGGSWVLEAQETD